MILSSVPFDVRGVMSTNTSYSSAYILNKKAVEECAEWYRVTVGDRGARWVHLLCMVLLRTAKQYCVGFCLHMRATLLASALKGTGDGR